MRLIGDKLAPKPVDVVEKSDGHHEQDHGNASALQPLSPGLRYAAARDAFPKIIHQVAAVQDRQW